MVGHEENIGKFKKAQVLSNVFSKHNTVVLIRDQLQGKNCKKHKTHRG